TGTPPTSPSPPPPSCRTWCRRGRSRARGASARRTPGGGWRGTRLRRSCRGRRRSTGRSRSVCRSRSSSGRWAGRGCHSWSVASPLETVPKGPCAAHGDTDEDDASDQEAGPAQFTAVADQEDGRVHGEGSGKGREEGDVRLTGTHGWCPHFLMVS